MANLANPEAIPRSLTEPLRVDVDGEPNPIFPIKPLRTHGRWQIDIEPCTQCPDVLALLQAPIDTAYQARFVGWHRGQSLGYGATPTAAAQALLEAS